MKTVLAVSLALLLVIVVWQVAKRRRGERVAPLANAASATDAYSGLRRKWLEGGFVGVSPGSEATPPFVLMEMGMGSASVLVVAVADGNASIYFSSGGGFLGGFAHESVREAARRTVAVAAELRAHLSVAAGNPSPAQGEVVFYVPSAEGMLTARALQADLVARKSPLAPLFFAGQDVITQYRLLSSNGERRVPEPAH